MIYNKEVMKMFHVKHSNYNDMLKKIQHDLLFNNLHGYDVKKSDGSKKGKVYRFSACPFSIDIETTSTVINGMEVAFPYIYQFAINHVAYFIREQTLFYQIIKDISSFLNYHGKKIICLIHNLSYEFTFFSGFLEFDSVFAIDKNKPIRADYGNICFYDSWIMSGYNLDNLAKNYCQTKKLVGDLDYRKYRNEKTPLTKKELAYCENDVLILNEYWQYIHKTYCIKIGKGYTDIPITNTSKVRQFVRTFIKNKKKLRDMLIQCQPSPTTKDMLQECFKGALVKSNALRTDMILYNVGSYDLTSSYPAVMLYGYYPMSKYVKSNEKTFDELDLENYCYLIRVKIMDLESKHCVRTLSFSKCRQVHNYMLDNGRLIKAKYLETTLDDIDLIQLKKFYTGKIQFLEVHKSKKGKLPKYLIEPLVNLYMDKDKIKKELSIMEKNNMLQSQEYTDLYINYMNIKGQLNSLYGMMVTKSHDIIYQWDNTKLEFLSEDNPNVDNVSWKDFLLWQWGVRVTSLARQVLENVILKLGTDFVYADTDSVKFLEPNKYKQLFIDVNNDIQNKVNIACEYYQIDSNNVKNIGLWDFEGVYYKFKTLGSKRYVYSKKVNKKNKTIQVENVVVSGISKKVFVNYAHKIKHCSVFDIFNKNLVIEEEYTNKTCMKYKVGNGTIDFKIDGIPIIKNYIFAQDVSFKIKMDKDYIKLLEEMLQLDYI